MRDKTGDPRFLLRKKIEAQMAVHYPGRWLPLYSQVTFSHTPYEQALAAGKRQDDIMESILDRPGLSENWNTPALFEEIIQRWETTA